MCERKMYYLYDFSLSFILSSYMCSCDMITGEWYKKRSFAEKEIWGRKKCIIENILILKEILIIFTT